ncbi:MAG TPA: hypothetical protein VH914_18140 [Acidimicrobiia bacterium]|jgi:hypothetical protein|nr:hypothetical protein [Acidimicrobiia bacterium]
MRATIVTDEAVAVDATADGDRLLLDADALHAAIGWEWKPEGLCRDDVCVPVRDRERLLVGDRLDLAAVADALGRPAVVDASAGLAAIALDAETRSDALRARRVPDFRLRDLDGVEHDFAQWHGKKRLLVAFASW